jgi:hypothetical protein
VGLAIRDFAGPAGCGDEEVDPFLFLAPVHDPDDADIGGGECDTHLLGCFPKRGRQHAFVAVQVASGDGEEAIGVAGIRSPEHEDVVSALEEDVYREGDTEALFGIGHVSRYSAISTQELNHRS